MAFQRARSNEQRNQRRRSILDTAAAMLAEMPVAELSLNELSRRVGLAKSNVLRYFESREAVLLELLDAQLRDWVQELDRTLTCTLGPYADRSACVADHVARTIAVRPVLCELIASQAAVLERNISADLALRHKRSIAQVVAVLVDAIRRSVPELTGADGYQVVVHTLLMISAAWPHSQPSAAVRAAYAADCAVAAGQLDFVGVVRDTVDLSIAGLLVRSTADEDLPRRHGHAEVGGGAHPALAAGEAAEAQSPKK